MGIIKNFSRQFGKPEGFLGSIAGKLMVIFGAEKIKWTISLLNIKNDDTVLEIGFGPGVGIELISKVIEDGLVIGIDYSDVMLQQAKKRNKNGIKEGKVDLRLADVNNLPSFDQLFDKVFSINSIIFWKKPIETLKLIRQVMKKNGVIAITVQPFKKGATEETAIELGNEIVNYLDLAGYSDIRIELKQMKPVPTVCVLGINSQIS